MNKKFFLPSVAAIFTAAFFIKNSALTASYIQKGLETCLLTVIPSLFPFMVVSEVLCECGALEFLGRLIGKRVPRLWGLSRKSFAAVTAGLIFGFPIGTRALVSLYDNGEISKDEFGHAVGFCGIPSFGFIVGVMGESFFSSKSFGIFMYVTAVLSALISGILFKKGVQSKYEFMPTSAPQKKNLSQILTDAISSSTGAIIVLCAYVVFFSCIIGCISEKLFSSDAGTVAGSLLELTAGIKASASIGGAFGVALCGFTVGWSGFSVHLQAMALTADRVESFTRYFVQKLFQGLLCALAAVAFSHLAHFTPAGTAAVFSSIFTPEYSVIMFMLFFFCLFHSKKHLIKIKNT